VRQFAKPPEGPLADSSVEVAVTPPELLAQGFRPLNRFRFKFAHRQEASQTADLLCSGASVAVLPLDLARGEIILLRQFRLAAHLANGRGGLFEIAAGHVEKNEKPAETARRECVEEIGCAPAPLIELFTYLTTPGLCDEQITVFLGIIDVSQIPERAGLAAEHEETFLVRVSIDRALAAVAVGSLRSGPLVMALNWLALNRGRLDDIVRAGVARP
jgi:ADP-ribose pyrophosphatase